LDSKGGALAGSHAPAWEPSLDAPASCVNHHDAGASSLHSHASAWEREKHLISSLPINEACVIRLAKLPLLHKDPFDRMLICQSIEHDLTIVTVDDAIRNYPMVKLLDIGQKILYRIRAIKRGECKSDTMPLPDTKQLVNIRI
jgi:PIN domain nuclease of toxin-antitoxin system